MFVSHRVFIINIIINIIIIIIVIIIIISSSIIFSVKLTNISF